MALKNASFSFLRLLVLAGLMVFQVHAFGQAPVITVRLANPQNDCVTGEYCLDVEARANMTGQEVFGINVRFFYDDDVLEFVDFRDFQGGYGPVAPDPPIISTSAPAGPALFNFTGPAEFVNGAMQKVSSGPPPIILDTDAWTKLFQICFLVDDQNANLDTFCPSVVWDLEQDPQNGGFLSGDDGVVVTIVDPNNSNESIPADENVVQFNWMYIGNGPPPYGQPVDSVCSNINCALPLTLLSFSGEALVSGNFLQWQVNDEINVDGYGVQTSANGSTWNKIGFLHAEVGGQMNHYDFLDVHPSPGISFYRLQLLDMDGRYRYSKMISVKNQYLSAKLNLNIYPNPVKQGNISIFIDQTPLPGAKIRLIGAAGEVLKEVLIDHSEVELDISDLAPGLYFVWLNSGEDTLVKRVLIQ
jgi:hypothetical protein